MQKLSQFTVIFNEYLEKKKFNKNPVELYAPVNYILSLGGKRIRPALLLAAFSVYKKDLKNALPIALAFEIFHNFTLLHDDVMDKAPLRRGKTTVHKKYGVNSAILSGDVMVILAYDLLLQLKNKNHTVNLHKIFNKVAIEVCEGQQMDMNFETRDDVTIKEYLKMIELKTAVLLGGVLKAGALLGGANKKTQKHFYKFGKNLGIAFQLQDDILDTFGEPKKFGKRIGGDIVQNKKTFLLLKAFQIADVNTQKKLQKLLNTQVSEDEKIRSVTEIYNRLKIKSLAEEKKMEYAKKAVKYLEKLGLDDENKSTFYGLIDIVTSRDY